MSSPRVFLSWCWYRNGELDAALEAWVTNLRAYLLAHGVTVWSDRDAEKGSDAWAHWMEQATEWADVFLAVITPDYAARWRAGPGTGVGWEATLCKVQLAQGQGGHLVGIQWASRRAEDFPPGLHAHGAPITIHDLTSPSCATLLAAIYGAPRRRQTANEPGAGLHKPPAGALDQVRAALAEHQRLCESGLDGEHLRWIIDDLERGEPDRPQDELRRPDVDRRAVLLRELLRARLRGRPPSSCPPDVLHVALTPDRGGLRLISAHARWRGSSRATPQWSPPADGDPCAPRSPKEVARTLHDILQRLHPAAPRRIPVTLVVPHEDAWQAASLLGAARRTDNQPTLDRWLHALTVWPTEDGQLVDGRPDAPIHPPPHATTAVVPRPLADVDAWAMARDGKVAVVVTCDDPRALPTHVDNLVTVLLIPGRRPRDVLPPGPARAALDVAAAVQRHGPDGRDGRIGLVAWTDSALLPPDLGGTL